MNHRLLLLALLIFGLVLAALASRTGGLLALAMPLLLYLGAARLSRPDRVRLAASRNLSATFVSAAEPVTVKLTLTNQGEALAEVHMQDLLPDSLTVVAGQTERLAALPPGGTVELVYSVRGERGLYRFPAVRVSLNDSLDLFRRAEVIAAPGEFLIWPHVTRLRRVDIRPRQTRVYSGIIPTRSGGPGVEFFGVREYQPGDPRRWLNSRASARHPHTLFVNEFEQERVADVGLILDAREQSDVRSPQGDLFEQSVRAVAALAELFLNNGNRVGLFIYGRSLDWTYPGYGKVQRMRLLHALARAEQGGGHVFEKLEHLPTRLFPARSQLVLVSPLLLADAEVLVKLRARGYRLLVVSPNPVTFEARGLAESPIVRQATRLAHLERSLLLAQLRQADIQLVDWAVETPFEESAQAALSRMRLR